MICCDGADNAVVLVEGHYSEKQLIGYVAPQTPLQQQLSDIWSELLEVEQVSIESNLFTLGVHSLLVIKLVSLIDEKCDVKFEVNDLAASDVVATQYRLVKSRK